jgi:putative lipoic acid-binding regulatory protein
LSVTENGSPFDFPCDIPVKIFGRNEASFREVVRTIVRTHFPDFAEDALRERPSRRDRFLSITVTVWVEDRAQIDALYTELTAHDDILIVL